MTRDRGRERERVWREIQREGGWRERDTTRDRESGGGGDIQREIQQDKERGGRYKKGEE